MQTPQEEVPKSHKKYEIRILYFSCKYTNTISLTSISNKRLKLINTKAAVKQKQLTIYAATILRLSSTQQ